MPFPHENKTGDDFVKENIKETDFMRYNGRITKKNIVKVAAKSTIFLFSAVLLIRKRYRIFSAIKAWK